MCVNCYNRIITDKELLQKCPICRHDIFENLNHILYVSMDDLINVSNEANINNAINLTNVTNLTNLTNLTNVTHETNIDNLYDFESFGDYDNNCVCTYNYFFTLFKNILLFLFIISISVLLIVILGFIAKTLYK
jgi:hypothetical protein